MLAFLVSHPMVRLKPSELEGYSVVSFILMSLTSEIQNRINYPGSKSIFTSRINPKFQISRAQIHIPNPVYTSLYSAVGHVAILNCLRCSACIFPKAHATFPKTFLASLLVNWVVTWPGVLPTFLNKSSRCKAARFLHPCSSGQCPEVELRDGATERCPNP